MKENLTNLNYDTVGPQKSFMLTNDMRELTSHNVKSEQMDHYMQSQGGKQLQYVVVL